jgi:hypothetical protein
MRDLQRLCIVCGQKRRCQHELARGTAAEHFFVSSVPMPIRSTPCSNRKNGRPGIDKFFRWRASPCRQMT